MNSYISNYSCTILAVFCLLASSCIKTAVSPDKPSAGNALTFVTYQYKWYDTTHAGAADQKITYNEATLNNSIVISNDTIYCSPSLPSSFSVDQVSHVSLSKLWAYATISDMAMVAPVDNAPAFGDAGDYSAPRYYKVTAASGDSKTYVIVTATIPELKVNKYMGNYAETGYFTHPTLPRALDRTKFLSYVDPSTVSCDLADLGASGYTMNIKVNSDNSCEVTQFLGGGPLANSQMVPGATNAYYPDTKTFILNYEYQGSSGWRIITDTLRKQ
ncbi:DUF4361 domain-containing protein [Flavitalea sp. BT771]|uniref:DUF5018-related domain-containing protein n=1 Tax=Flavitalea sp. BT771 TaxID=3063329 RepID=UPI0026E48E57|nr:DUF4361 domain-containing protein [Flavitalea sp. BT771]MDO6432794.1 DUF4361 domain-containing protein [Flavitalea sp. BT771]MDV6221930.1 DUF4361 domain-containing protein [Flavitalea sp. BT771]